MNTWKNRAALFSLSIVLTATLLAGCDTPIDAESVAADLVLTNGKIVTVDPTLPEAQALAVVGDTIMAIGSSDEIAQYIGPTTQVIDLLGRVGHVVVEPPGQECEKRAGEERCSNLDRDGGPVAGVRAPFQPRSRVP